MPTSIDVSKDRMNTTMTSFPQEKGVILMPQFCFFVLSKTREAGEITVKVA